MLSYIFDCYGALCVHCETLDEPGGAAPVLPGPPAFAEGFCFEFWPSFLLFAPCIQIGTFVFLRPESTKKQAMDRMSPRRSDASAQALL